MPGGFYWVLLGFTGFLLGFSGFSYFLPDFIRSWRVSIGIDLVLLVSTRFSLVKTGFTGFYWVLLGFYRVSGDGASGVDSVWFLLLFFFLLVVVVFASAILWPSRLGGCIVNQRVIDR